MSTQIIPTQFSRTDEGIPYSTLFDDVYHTADGGLGQSRHVFLAGNGLPLRWQGQARFTILETGFGLGLNFLTTWAAWQDDPSRCAHLHFISVEKHPFRTEDLAQLHASWPELASQAEALRRHWPALTAGIHRIHLDGGRVTLTLIFGDALDALPQLDARVNAFYLDGFAPACNPELWSATLFAQLARLVAPGASIATWSANGDVRRGLQAAGFVAERCPGFGGKREMLAGVDYGPDVFPMPFAFADDRIPPWHDGARSRLLFWAGERRYGLRALYLDRIESLLDLKLGSGFSP
ncbi:MAG: tRNA (5-methylaminomethyl-2-thiouridine)(34)-methyltransferase MnmD, partial [Thiobacillus sp.]|nr:tRNA (5-methylaminomethyl-2-thiouridine)(34)-methyltransferase MnmD [Thiobacillus sp.]